MASEKYVSIEKVETRQWWMLGIFTVLACVGVALAIYKFNSRISVLEEKTNNLQNIIELYEKKNKEIKEENEKYYKSIITPKKEMLASNNSVVFCGGIYE